MHNLDQHTLKEKEFIQQAVSLAQIKKKDSILEVGAGPGNITSCIAEKGAQVDAYEIDARWKPELEKIEKTYDNLVVYYQDALKADWHRYTLLISNVPFTNAEALIQKLLLSRIKLAVLFVSEHLAKVLQS
ncbi:hypothetical protein HYZ97_04640, partial [Candidatus Pacearchaeota archaeon]|nr:hypothetical protein [Candidatus Pacearchaeota archaeon]